MSGNFDRKVCNRLQSTKNYSAVKFKYTSEEMFYKLYFTDKIGILFLKLKLTNKHI